MSDLSKPERSRNAKAQARHRAKRKAYIEQLEQTVTKLQTAMGVTPDQVAALPPPMAKIRELEQENTRLAKENDELRRLLSDSGIPITGPAASNTGGYGSPQNSFNATGRGLQLNRSLTGGSSANGPSGAFHDTRNLTDSYGGLKRRKMSHELDSNFPSENTDLNSLRAPPPLTIPQHPSSHHYSSSHPSSHPSSQISSPHPNSAHGPPSHHFNLAPPPPFQMPHTPSGSSATSSPPFSPAQMTPAGSVSHSPVSQLSSLSRPGTGSSVSSMHPYSGYVKVEEDNYHTSHHNSSHHPSSHSSTPSSTGYSLPPFDTMDPTLAGHGAWQSHYSTSERVGSGGLGRFGNFHDWRQSEGRDSAVLA